METTAFCASKVKNTMYKHTYIHTHYLRICMHVYIRMYTRVSYPYTHMYYIYVCMYHAVFISELLGGECPSKILKFPLKC